MLNRSVWHGCRITVPLHLVLLAITLSAGQAAFLTHRLPNVLTTITSLSDVNKGFKSRVGEHQSAQSVLSTLEKRFQNSLESISLIMWY